MQIISLVLRVRRIIFTFLVTVIVCRTVMAKSWVGDTNANLNNPLNWGGDTLPLSTQAAEFDSAGAGFLDQIDVTSDFSIREVDMFSSLSLLRIGSANGSRILVNASSGGNGVMNYGPVGSLFEINCGLVLNGTNGVGFGIGLDEGMNKGDIVVNGVIEGGNILFKQGDGKLILNAANTYGGYTRLHQGDLIVNGSIASSDHIAIYTATTLSGTGIVPRIQGNGLVSPGGSAGILTASSVDPAFPGDEGGPMQYAFELTQTGSPIYGSSNGSKNDVLRITGATPLSSPLTNNNDINVYLGMASLSAGDVFRGGFYLDFSTDFAADVKDGNYSYFVLGDGGGSHEFNSVNYYTLAEYSANLSVDVTTVADTANFGGGTVNGGVTQFTVALNFVPGDFDGDGDVDGADFVVWQTNFPAANGHVLATGDADGDGDVDGADFVVWQTNFPFTPGPGVAFVPEPKSLILALGLSGLLLMFPRTRTHTVASM